MNKKIIVKNSLDAEWNGEYFEGNVKCKDKNSTSYVKDSNHHIFLYNKNWRLGESGVRLYKVLGNKIENEIDLNMLIPDVKKLTYLSYSALFNLRDNVLKTEKLNGIIIETGCAKGGSSICIAHFKGKNKRFQIYDTFSLIPPPTENDGKDCQDRFQFVILGKENKNYYGYQTNLIETVENTFDEFNLNIKKNNIELIKGLYEDTLKINEPVSFAHIDCDWYDSVMTSLKEIEPNLIKGGIITLDDYYSWSGCKKATDEYFKNIKDNYLFQKISNKLNIVKI